MEGGGEGRTRGGCGIKKRLVVEKGRIFPGLLMGEGVLEETRAYLQRSRNSIHLGFGLC